MEMLKKQNIRILTPKISDDKKGAFFYKDSMAHGIREDGVAVLLIANGEIRLEIDGENYDNKTKDDAIIKYGLTDEKLKELEKEGRLIWKNNNWFEVIWTREYEKCWKFAMDVVAFDYDEAIKMFTDYYNSGVIIIS